MISQFWSISDIRTLLLGAGTNIFREEGRSLPIFSDKHLSWNWELAQEMVATSKELSFPFMGGSGLSVTWRMPSVDLPYGAAVEESLILGGGWPDGGSFHMIEFTQTLLERRKGGETGVAWVEALKGEEVFEALEKGSFALGGFDDELFETALCRSHSIAQARPGYSARYPTTEELRKMWSPTVCFRWQYTDGTCATMLFGNGLVGDYPFAAKLASGEIFSTLCHLPAGSNVGYSAMLMHCAQTMFVTGKEVFPIERTLVATGVVRA